MLSQAAGAAVAADQWVARRLRARELAERWPFAGEVLGFYGALVDVQAAIFEAARRTLGGSVGAGDAALEIGGRAADMEGIIAYVVRQALPPVRDLTRARGPQALAAAAGADVTVEEWEDHVGRWLSGGGLTPGGPAALSPAEQFLARAASAPVLEALGGQVSPGGNPQPGGGGQAGDERRCPRCAGLPQLSVYGVTGEDLVAPRRYLECSRCMSRWPFLRLVCAACGETDAARLPILAEEGTAEVEATGSVVRGAASRPASSVGGAARFPHLSIHACRTCSRYLLNVDLARDARAVPVVDELAAIPLDLYAREQGLTKITPNLMGL